VRYVCERSRVLRVGSSWWHDTHSMAFALRACEHADRQSELVGVTVAQNDMALLLPHTTMCWMCFAHAEAEAEI
jgi:hypothetical protein